MGESNKPTRFAGLIRVSTEKQEKQGESLLTQRKSLEKDVEQLGGKIVAWYGGQEHATLGWERGEVDRLIADAGRSKWEAVMVAYADRWSRDNLKSKEGLEAFRRAGARFFVGSSEMNLFDPQVRFLLGMHAEVGEFLALQTTKKTLESKIERAKRGIPTSGSWPFGRVWNSETKTWSINPQAQALIQEVARRVLDGEQLGKLAILNNMAVANLWKILRHRCGDDWQQTFRCKALNIQEAVPCKIPRLLDDKTIRAVAVALESRRRFLHKPPRSRDYLLSGRVFCICGYSLTGEFDKRCGLAYYHHHIDNRWKKSRCSCPIRPRPRVRADWLESEVIHQLFSLFGNPAAIERAVQSAVPRNEEMVVRKEHLDLELAKIERARDRILALVIKDVLTDEQAEKQLRELKTGEDEMREERDRIARQLDSLPSQEELRIYVEKVNEMIFLQDDLGNSRLGGNDVGSLLAMSYTDKRELIEAVFAKPFSDGSPAGVYVGPSSEPRQGKRRSWCLLFKGQFQFNAVVPMPIVGEVPLPRIRDVGVPFAPCPPEKQHTSIAFLHSVGS